MENGLDLQHTLLDFLKSKKELINSLNIFYVKNPKEFIGYVLEQKLSGIFLKKIKEYRLDATKVLFYKKLEVIGEEIKQLNIEKFKIGLEFVAFFQEKGIKLTPYKGFVYSYLAYGTPYAREMADLDFLLEKPADIYKIFALLKDNKAFNLEYGKKLDENLLYWNIKNNFELTVIYKNVIFEIHPAIRDSFYFFPRANYSWWNNFGTEILDIEGKKISIPKKEIFLLEIFCHNVYHAWCPLSMPFDMYYLLKNNVFDWNFIKQEAKNLGVTNILNEGLLYVYETTGIEPYENFSNLQQKAIVSKVVKEMEKNNIYLNGMTDSKLALEKFHKKFLRSIEERETLFDKIGTIFQYLFVPTRRDYEILKLPKQLYFLYYIFNPFFIILNRIRSVF